MFSEPDGRFCWRTTVSNETGRIDNGKQADVMFRNWAGAAIVAWLFGIIVRVLILNNGSCLSRDIHDIFA